MANKDAPFGFRPVGELGSEIQNGGTTRYQIADAYASNIFKGDLVYISDGAIVDNAGNAPTKGTIGVSSNTCTISIGVFNGCFYIAPTTKKPTKIQYPKYCGSTILKITDANNIKDVIPKTSGIYFIHFGKNLL